MKTESKLAKGGVLPPGVLPAGIPDPDTTAETSFPLDKVLQRTDGVDALSYLMGARQQIKEGRLKPTVAILATDLSKFPDLKGEEFIVTEWHWDEENGVIVVDKIQKS